MRWFLVLILFSANLWAQDLPGIYVITRTTQIYKLPSTKSEIKGEASAPTEVIIRKLSKSGKWAYVEDEDKNNGWIPTARTNFEFKADAEKAEEREQRIEKESEKEDANIVESIPGGSGIIPILFFSSRGWGASLGGYFFESGLSGPHRQRRIGIDLGVYQHWNRNSSELTSPLRVRMLARDHNSTIVSGPDVGALYRWSQERWGATLGYTLGVSLKSILLLSRLGAEFGGPTHVTIEFGLGYEF